MITTVTLNAAIDKTNYFSHFRVGESHRATKMFAEAGGKGINVARTLLQLGFKPMATGFLGGNNEMQSSSSEILESGPMITSEELVKIKIKVAELAKLSTIIAFSGSLPKGLPSPTRATVPSMKVVNTVGCGDAFIAGMISGFNTQEPIIECIRLAAATGSAAALSQQAGYIKLEEVERIKALVEIEEITHGV